MEPDITQYPQKVRVDYLKLVAAMAAADGYLHPAETALLQRWMTDFALDESAQKEVLEVAQAKPDDQTVLKQPLEGTPLVYSLVLDMVTMAMVDGVLMDEERLLLLEVAAHLGLHYKEFSILIEFVHSAYQAATLINPEPLYEHNIETAFELFRRKEALLFPHNLFCTNSPGYDSQLKQRWLKAS